MLHLNPPSVSQVDELRVRVRELEERERKESKKLADEDALRKIRVAEETIDHLQKKLTATKQVLYIHYTFKTVAEVLNMLNITIAVGFPWLCHCFFF